MKQLTTVTVLIDKKAGVSVEVDGVKGGKCTDVTKQLEEALGTVSKRDKKPDYFKKEEIYDKTKVGA